MKIARLALTVVSVAMFAFYLGTKSGRSALEQDQKPKASIGEVTGLMHFQVIDVPAGSPAERAGLRQGDFIREVNGAALTTISSLFKRIEETEVGQAVELTCLRVGPSCDSFQMKRLTIQTEGVSDKVRGEREE